MATSAMETDCFDSLSLVPIVGATHCLLLGLCELGQSASMIRVLE